MRGAGFHAIQGHHAHGPLPPLSPAAPTPDILAGGGATGALLRAHPWADGPLGPPGAWPAELRTLLGIMLGSSQPMFVAWGPGRTLLYNDAYAEILAAKHPAAIGRDFLEVWHEIRADLLPIVQAAYGGEPVRMDRITLVMERRGFREEAYFAFSYTPVRDAAGAVGGFFCACTETTAQVQAERALLAERERLRSVLDGMGEARGLLDREFRILDLNAAAVRMDGRGREAMVGRSHWEVHPGTEDGPVGDLYRRVLATGVPGEMEHRYRWPDGKETWLSLRVFPVPEGIALFYADITARRAAEDAAREASERLALALDAGAIIGTWVWDVPGDRFTADARFARSFGLDPARCAAGLSLDEVTQSVHPEDLAGVQAAIGEALGRGGAYRREYRVRPQGGGWRWITATGRVELGADGRPLRFPGVLLDSHERRATEAALREAEERLRLSTELSDVGFWDVDPATDAIIWPARVKAMFGITHERPITMADFRAGLHPDDAPAVMAAFEAATDPARRALYDVEYRTIGLEDGVLRWVAARGRGIFDAAGRCTRVLGTAMDITARKASESRLRRVLDGLFAFVGLLDTEGRLVEANAAPLRAAGLAPAEVIGRPFWDTPWWSHDAAVQARIRDAVREAASGATPRFDVPVRVAGGALLTLDFQVAPLRDDAGAITHLVPSGVVVEERVRAEQSLRELNATLEQRVRDAVAEREQAEEALRQAQKMEAVGQLTGGVAHDFNNLLTVVKGNIDMAQRALAAAGVDDARSRRALDNAMKGAERAASLTQRLLAFSRRQPLAPKALDLDRLVGGMGDMLHRTLGETVRLEMVTTPGLWRVEADPNQLESAILNLAVNARDAMPRGGTLTIETANARLDAGYATQHAEVAPGQYVVLAVTDTGTGMPREVMARVFEPFFTTKEAGHGTGLGLSQVYGFTKQSGGHVKLYSEEGQGTTVKIYLPRLMAEAAPEDAAEAQAPAALEGTRRQEVILAVEDDDDVRAYTVECLRELGYRVVEAADGASALRLMERLATPVDLLFTDVVMPGMSGRELADAARERQGDLRVLYTSGYTRNAIVHGGRLDAGVEMLPKPFTFAALAQAVRDALDRGRGRRALLAGADPDARLHAAEALSGAGWAVEEVATAAELLAQARAAQGGHDAVLLLAPLPDKGEEALLAELRALFEALPVLSAMPLPLPPRFAGDRCMAALPAGWDGASLNAALRELGLRCAG